MSRDVVVVATTPLCDYRIGGVGGDKCNKPTDTEESTRINFNLLPVLQMDLCDEHWAPIEALYADYRPGATVLGEPSYILKRIQKKHKDELWTKRILDPDERSPFKRYTVYYLRITGFPEDGSFEEYFTSDLQEWAVLKGLREEYRPDGQKKSGLFPDHLADAWAEEMTAKIKRQRRPRPETS